MMGQKMFSYSSSSYVHSSLPILGWVTFPFTRYFILQSLLNGAKFATADYSVPSKRLRVSNLLAISDIWCELHVTYFERN